jgi:protein tyrosine/serine phosphatase
MEYRLDLKKYYQHLSIITFIILIGTAASAGMRIIGVTEQILRSNAPISANDYAFLAQHPPKAIISLSAVTDENQREKQWAKEKGINFIMRPIDLSQPIRSKEILKILDTLDSLAKEGGPVLIHCEYGRDRTGLLIGLYRVLKQGWKPKDAFREMLDHGYSGRYPELNRIFGKLTEWKIPFRYTHFLCRWLFVPKK